MPFILKGRYSRGFLSSERHCVIKRLFRKYNNYRKQIKRSRYEKKNKF